MEATRTTHQTAAVEQYRQALAAYDAGTATDLEVAAAEEALSATGLRVEDADAETRYSVHYIDAEYTDEVGEIDATDAAAAAAGWWDDLQHEAGRGLEGEYIGHEITVGTDGTAEVATRIAVEDDPVLGSYEYSIRYRLTPQA